jgi:hypothetical protein
MKNAYFSLLLLFIFFNFNLNATDYYLKTSGNAHLAASWGTTAAGNGSGDSPANFNGAHTWHFTNRTSVNMTSAGFSTPSTAIVIVESATSVTVASLGTLGSASINIASGGSLTLTRNITYNLNSLDANSTVVYNNVNLPVYAENYGHLTIAASTTLSGTADINVNGTLTINSGRTLTMDGGGAVLYISSIAGTGSLTGNATALLSFSLGASGNNGTVNFTSGSQLLQVLSLDYTSTSSYISLGTPLTITGGFLTQNSGGLSLNGQTLTVDATSDISFDGTSPIHATGNSAMVIEGTVGANITNILTMDATENTIRSFTLNSPGGTIQLANTLNLTDNLDVLDGTFDSNGFLVLNADATRSARVGPIGATGAITGNVSVETFAPGGFTGWTNMGVSGVSGQTIANWENNPIPMTCTGCLYDPSSVGGFSSIQGWDEATNNYVAPLTVGTALTPGTGFWVYLGNGSSTTTPLTWTFNGSLVTGNVNVPLSTSGSLFNLLANPYASPISWDQVAGDNGLTTNDAIYIYNPDLGVTTSYVVSSGLSSLLDATGTPTAGGTALNSANNVIPAGQAFYYEASIFDPTTITFSETQKLTDNTSANPLLKGASTNEAKTNKKIARLKLAGAFDWDMTAFRMDENSSFNKSKGDAWKIFQSPGYQGLPGPYSKYTTISSRTPIGEDLSINTFPATSNSVSIPVLVRVSTTGNYTISAQDFENWPSCVVLRDKINGAMTDLTKNNYTFFISDTTAAPRFELIVCGSGAGAVDVNELVESNNNVLIQQTNNGTVVKTNFEQSTKATISAYNVIGQKIMQDVVLEGRETSTLLNIDTKEQIAIIKVSTDKEVFTKKVVVH